VITWQTRLYMVIKHLLGTILSDQIIVLVGSWQPNVSWWASGVSSRSGPGLVKVGTGSIRTGTRTRAVSQPNHSCAKPALTNPLIHPCFQLHHSQFHTHCFKIFRCCYAAIQIKSLSEAFPSNWLFTISLGMTTPLSLPKHNSARS
jgi:hypothetical protein